MNRKLSFVFLVIVLVFGLSFPQLGAAASSQKNLRIAVSSEPTSIDVSADTGGATRAIFDNVNELLVYSDADGKLAPQLATAWTVSPDGKVIEFTIRKGVKFHSGDPLTAADVVFSYERGKKKNRVMPSRLRQVAKIEALDDYHVKFTFKKSDVTFIPKTAAGTLIVSKTYYERVGEEKFAKAPVGTGPYKMVGYAQGQYIDIERFEDYWGKKSDVRGARFYIAPEATTRIAKLQAGEVDLVQGVPYNLIKSIDEDPNFKTMRLETNTPPASIVFATRNKNVPWSDKRVRLAMAYAIDADSIVSKVLFGAPNHCPWLCPGELGYDPTVKTYPYDPEKAKKLLAEAGYPKGFDLTLTWAFGGRVPMAGQVVQAIASYLEAVGIRTKLKSMEIDAYRKARKAGQKPTSDFVGFYSGNITGSSEPASTAEGFFTCKGRMSVYCNPEFDQIVEIARTTMDDAKRAALIHKLVLIMKEDVANIPIFETVEVFGMKKNIDFVPIRNISMPIVLLKNITMK